ncbi:hypothetical protein ABPG74_009527 [Tetrahymena malaccensis]
MIKKQTLSNFNKNLIVQKPALSVEYEVIDKYENYFFIHSEDLKYIYFDQENQYCSKVTKYESTSYIFEIHDYQCSMVKFIVVSNNNKINLIMDIPYVRKHYKDQNQQTTHMFLIGICYIIQQSQYYNLLSHVYYKIQNNDLVFMNGISCLYGSKILNLSIQQDANIEEYEIELLLNRQINIRLSKQYAICLYLKDQQNLEIIYGSSINKLDDKQDNIDKFKQAEIGQNGSVCISYEQDLSIFQHENLYIIAKGQGYFSYKQIRIKFSYDFNQLYGQINSIIQASTQPIQIIIDNQQKTKKMIMLRYSDKCQIVEQTENQNIAINLENQISSSHLINNILIYYSVSYQLIDTLEEIKFSDVSNRKIILNKKIDQQNKAFKFYLPQEFKDSDFIIELFCDSQSFSTILGRRSTNEDFFSPVLSSNQLVYYIQKEIVQQIWIEDPLVIICTNPTQLSLKRNYFDDKIQIYNFNFKRIIQLNIDQIIKTNGTVYIDLQSNKITQISNKYLFNIKQINQSLYKLKVILNQHTKENQINEKNIDIQYCCGSSQSSPIKVFFNYLYEQDEEYLKDDTLLNYFNDNLLIYCWGTSLNQEYYRYNPYNYTRIFNQEELSNIYSLDKENIFKVFEFRKKPANQPIIRQTEICLVLKLHEESSNLSIDLSNQSYILEREYQFPYNFIYFQQSTNKIIQVILENESQSLLFQQFNCSNASYYYSQIYLMELKIQRNAEDYQQVQQKIKVRVIDQQVEFTHLNSLFKLTFNKWIFLRVDKFKDYQILQQSNQMDFYVDYWLSNYELKFVGCSQPNLKIPPQIDGVLSKENNIIKNTEFLYLYLKASPDFNSDQFLFLVKEFSQIDLINQENFILTQQVLQNYVFKNPFLKRIFKIEHQNELSFNINFCSKISLYPQGELVNENNIKLFNKLKEINSTYVFIYPEISLQQNQEFNSIQNLILQSQTQICLQIKQKENNSLNQNATGTILNQELTIQQLKINQVFDIQINSKNNHQNQYVILEVEKSDTNYFLYLEYKFIEEKPVLFELRYLQSGNTLQRFYFQQSQDTKILSLQNIKYIEIYNYEPSTNIELTLILSQQQFSITNIYRKEMSFISFKTPLLLLLSRLPDQNLIVYLKSNLDKTNDQIKLEPHQIGNIFINNDYVNYQFNEVHPNQHLGKKFYFLEILDLNVQVDIQIKYYNSLLDFHRQLNISAYEYTLNKKTFKFKTKNEKLINKIGENIDVFGLQNQKIYFVFSTNEYSLEQEFVNGINKIENNQNIVMFKEYLLEFKQNKYSIEYDITTTYFQNQQIQKLNLNNGINCTASSQLPYQYNYNFQIIQDNLIVTFIIIMLFTCYMGNFRINYQPCKKGQIQQENQNSLNKIMEIIKSNIQDLNNSFVIKLKIDNFHLIKELLNKLIIYQQPSEITCIDTDVYNIRRKKRYSGKMNDQNPKYNEIEYLMIVIQSEKAITLRIDEILLNFPNEFKDILKYFMDRIFEQYKIYINYDGYDNQILNFILGQDCQGEFNWICNFQFNQENNQTLFINKYGFFFSQISSIIALQKIIEQYLTFSPQQIYYDLFDV